MGSGEERLNILPETLLYSVYGREDGAEQYYCNYGVNEDYEARLQAAGLRVSARGTHGEPRAVELVHHRFFLATLFQPQLSSRPDAPHPIWLAFLRAAMRFKTARSRRPPGRGRHSDRRAPVDR